MDVGWIFGIGFGIAGLVGLIGLRQERKGCLLLSAMALPVLFFAALWAGISLSHISCYFCITAFLALCGLREE